jgi:hypothetical protein
MSNQIKELTIILLRLRAHKAILKKHNKFSTKPAKYLSQTNTSIRH